MYFYWMQQHNPAAYGIGIAIQAHGLIRKFRFMNTQSLKCGSYGLGVNATPAGKSLDHISVLFRDTLVPLHKWP